MKKFICAILSLALCGAIVFFGACRKDKEAESEEETAISCEDNSEEASSDTDSENGEEEEHKTLVSNAELVEYFTNMVNGNALYINVKATVKTTSSLQGTVIGEKNANEIIIDGGEAGATLTATGGGVGAIQPAEGATLVFKNLEIRDDSLSTVSTEDRRQGYLEFGGKLRFENCTFSCAAYLCDDADAQFVNCEFNSGAENMYAMWISDGSASFKDCTFEGWRAIKLYEGSDNRYTSVQAHYDVEKVVVDGCLFNNLKKKPGIAIDVFQGKETSITIKNSEFDCCQEWSKDSYEGLLSVYESDVDTSTITLVIEEVISEGLLVEWENDREFGAGAPNA